MIVQLNIALRAECALDIKIWSFEVLDCTMRYSKILLKPIFEVSFKIIKLLQI